MKNKVIAVVIGITPGIPSEGHSNPAPQDVTFLYFDSEGLPQMKKINNESEFNYHVGSLWCIKNDESSVELDPFFINCIEGNRAAIEKLKNQISKLIVNE
ncbi:MAG TPA: hypothetical protein PLC53_03455, partial [Bacilli bacterium]|nr:hypothetical protein [Bacilli bacterium]